VVETAKSSPKIVRYFLAAGFLIPCLLYVTCRNLLVYKRPQETCLMRSSLLVYG
jgi:hypothetical protein